MAEQEKPADYVIVAEPASETLKAALELVKQQPGQDKLHVIYAANQSEVVNHVTTSSPCLVMLSFLESNDLVGGLGLLSAIASKLEQKEVKAIALTKIQNPKFLKVLEKQKVSVVISEPIAMRTLMFKLLLQIKSLDVIRKSIEQKIKQNEKIQFRNNTEDSEGQGDQSALRFKRAENGQKKSFLLAGDTPEVRGPEVKAGVSDSREVFQKVATERLKASSLATDADPAQTAAANQPGRGPASDETAESPIKGKTIPHGEGEKKFSRSAGAERDGEEAATASSKGTEPAAEASRQPKDRPTEKEIQARAEKIKKMQLETALERMREEKARQIAKEGRALKAKEESATRAKTLAEETQKKRRERAEKIDRQSAEKKAALGADPGEAPAAPERAEKAPPSRGEEKRNHSPRQGSGPGTAETGADESSRDRPGSESPDEAGSGKERGAKSGLGGPLAKKAGLTGAKKLGQEAEDSSGLETERGEAAKSPTENESADQSGQEEKKGKSPHAGPQKPAAKEKKKREKKAISEYLEEIVRQSKALNARRPEDPSQAAGPEDDEAEAPDLDDLDTQATGSSKAEAEASDSKEGSGEEELNATAEGEGQKEKSLREKGNQPAEEEPSERGREPQSAAGEPTEKEGLFEFGHSQEPNSWSDLDAVDAKKTAKAKRGFSDNFEDSTADWDAKNRTSERRPGKEQERIPEVLLAKSQITPDPGSWVKVGKFYVYCKESLYAHPINSLLEALPLCVYEGEEKPASRGIFWLFQRQKPLIVETEGELDPAVARFLAKFFRAKLREVGGESSSQARKSARLGESVEAGSPAEQKRLTDEVRHSPAAESGVSGQRNAGAADLGAESPSREEGKGEVAASGKADTLAETDASPPEDQAPKKAARAQDPSDSPGGSARRKRDTGLDDRLEALSEELERQSRALGETEEAGAKRKKASRAEEESLVAGSAARRRRDVETESGEGPKPSEPEREGGALSQEREPKREKVDAEPTAPGKQGAKNQISPLLGDLLSQVSRKPQPRGELLSTGSAATAVGANAPEHPATVSDLAQKNAGSETVSAEANGKRILDLRARPLVAPEGRAEEPGERETGNHSSGELQAKQKESAAIPQPTDTNPSSATSPSANAPPASAAGADPGIDGRAESNPPASAAKLYLEPWQIFAPVEAVPPTAAPARFDPRSRAEEMARQLSRDQEKFALRLSRGQELALHMASVRPVGPDSDDSNRELLTARARIEMHAPNLMVAAVKVALGGEFVVIAGECPFRNLAELEAAEDSAWSSGLRPNSAGLVAVAREGKRKLAAEERLTLERVGQGSQPAAA